MILGKLDVDIQNNEVGPLPHHTQKLTGMSQMAHDYNPSTLGG